MDQSPRFMREGILLKTQPAWSSGKSLRLERIRVLRGGIEILKGVDLDFQADRRYVLVGPSGSGKSTLLRLLNRLEDPASGSILVGESPIRSLPIQLVRRRIGLVFQSPRPLPGTVAENLAYPFSTRGLPLPGPEILRESLREVGLDVPLDRDATRLSGGERQRLAIAVALAIGPEILALDEPTSSLDLVSADRVCEVLARRSETAGLRTIAVCHDRNQAEKLGTWGVAIVSGRVVDQGPIAEILRRVDLPTEPSR